jgi:hypothetical protein
MAKMQWVKWKDHYGVKYRGEVKYDPPQPWDEWQKIMGVVARCEGNHDTCVSYDGTGMTWGFGQWTFTSGRLQKLLESFKSIPYYDFSNDEDEDGHHTLFDDVCCHNGFQYFRAFGFEIRTGKFFDLQENRFLDPRKPAQKKRMVDVCMGIAAHPKNFKQQKKHAIQLANIFAKIGKDPGVAAAQIQFAEAEFKRQLKYDRNPLGGKSIEWLLDTDVWHDGLWHQMLCALFFNLWQNSPGAAYRLFKNSRKRAAGASMGGSIDSLLYFNEAWRRVNRSKFGNWGWGKPGNKSPRVVRIKKAFEEFYGVDLNYYKS